MRRILLALLLLLPLAAAPAAPPPAGQPQVLNLKDADIQALIATVSQITGKNFIVGPNVQGTVTVVSSRPMRADEIYQVFLSVLAVHGYAALPAGDGMIKIVSEASARGDGAIGVGATSDQGDPLITQVVPVHYVSAAELATILQQFAPQGGRIVAHGPSNSLILSDRASVVRRLQEIIARVDTASDAQVEVIPLQHADAAEMARTLTRLDGEQQSTTPGAVRVLADTRTNSILLSGDKSRRLRLRTLILHLDTPLVSGGATQVVYLNYANAKDLVPILENVVRSLAGEGTTPVAATANAATVAGGNAPTSIQADEKTNALVITATPAVFRNLQSVIRQLDIRRAQVLIEAVIAEVGLQTAKEIGVQWQLPLKANADGSINHSVIGGTNFTGTDGSGNILGLAQDLSALGGGLNLGYINGSITLPGSDTPILQIGALIRALQGDSNSNVLSTPNVVTLDNHEAKIKVTQEVPFITGQYTNTASGGTNLPTNPFQTIERKDVGITLTVTPHINEGDSVRLDIDQVVSSLAPQVTGAVDLVTNNREVKTSVLVADDSILVLGGLISNDVSDTAQKVPLLGDIPLLGNLFRYRSGKRTKQDLMVFLHPKILRDAATEDAVSSEKYNYIRTEQLQMRDDDSLLSPRDKRPLLPEMHDFLAHPPAPAAGPPSGKP
jgi:general secretion pathway protein D